MNGDPAQSAWGCLQGVALDTSDPPSMGPTAHLWDLPKRDLLVWVGEAGAGCHPGQSHRNTIAAAA